MMEDETNRIESSFRESPIAVFLLVLQFAFIIGVIISIVKILEPANLASVEYNYENQSQIPINNLAKHVPNLSTPEINNTERMLFWAVNNNISEVDLTSVQAEIRDDTVKSAVFEEQNLNYFSLVVDIPSIKQSYQIYYAYPGEGNIRYLDPGETAIVLCVDDPQLVIYPDFDCHDAYEETYDGVARNAMVAGLLWYFNFDDFEVAVTDDYQRISVVPYQSEQSQAKTDGYIEEVKDAITSLGVSPELFTYDVKQPAAETFEQY